MPCGGRKGDTDAENADISRDRYLSSASRLAARLRRQNMTFCWNGISVERRIVSGTDDGLFSGDPVSLATHSGRGDMNCAV